MKLPKIPMGYKRAYHRCKTCKSVYYRDYIPFSLGNPIITMSCGHSFYQGNTEIITKEEAMKYFNPKTKETAPGLYKVNLYGGYVGIIRATSLKNARSKAIQEEGSNNVESVSKATKDDINWVKKMGGRIP